MPGENFLIAHWQSEATSLHNYLFASDPTQKAIVHKIRVSIKKLRSYLKLFILVSGSEYSRQYFSPTEMLFTVMGEHRNLEINKSKAREICCGNEDLYWSYLSWLNERQEKFNIPAAILQYSPAGIDELTKIMNGNIGHLQNEDLFRETSAINIHYLEKVRKHMHHFRKNFHEVRKELKVIFYLAKISFPYPAFSKQEMHLLEEVLDNLGHVQDDEVTLSLLHSFRHSISTHHEKNIIHDSITAVEMRKEELLLKAKEGAERFVYNVTVG